MDHFDRSSPFPTVLAERHANPQIFIPIDGFGHPTPHPSHQGSSPSKGPR